MKLSTNWLQEFIDLKGISAEKIAEKLTLHTCEIEEVVNKSSYFQNVFAGKLLATKKHENSEKLNIGTFYFGEKIGEKQIIFGNVFELKVDEIYLIALDGANLASGIEIKNCELRGEKSEGMVCTNQELGMKNDGFFRSTDQNLIGQEATEIFAGFRDFVLDVDNKSLTHRPDLMGHYGLARELKAIFGENNLRSFLDEKVKNEIANSAKNSAEKVEVDIQTPLCRRFCSLKMSKVQVAPSNYETQIRLENLETRAISNLVDITNLILLGFGQPMHVFDAQKVQGKIIVRPAKNGEKIVALDGETYELTSEDLVIADEEKALSIAGIMGGLESSVTEKTTEIIFESANFDPTTVRKTSQRLGLRSESSMRYEKSLDPEQCLPALIKAVALVKKVCPNAKIQSAITDNFPQKSSPIFIDLEYEKVRKIAGIQIDNEKIKEILTSLEFKLTDSNEQSVKVEIPTFRATKDINIAEDLIEEVVRIYGFENIQNQLPALPITPPRKNKLRQQDWKLRDFWVSKNFTEVYHSSFVGSQDAEFTDQADNYVQIANPSNDECKFLRQTLVSNFVRHLKSELRTHSEVRFFELGKVYTKPYAEEARFAIFWGKLKGDAEKMFYELKADLSSCLENLNLPAEKIDFKPLENPANFVHPYASAEIFIDNQAIGYLGMINPSQNSVKNSKIVFAEIKTETLQNFAENFEKKYQKVSAFPAVHRDISILVERKTLVGDLIKLAKKSAPYLTKIELFDDFLDAEKFGENKKNLAFHLTFQALDKTLSEEEIDQNFQQIMDIWQEKFGAQLRLEFDQNNTKI